MQPSAGATVRIESSVAAQISSSPEDKRQLALLISAAVTIF